MLKTKQVGIYTCSQMGPLQSARMRLFQKQIEAEKNADEATLDALNEWAFLAACTMPLLTKEEYLSTPVLELQQLSEAIAELNDDMVQVGEKQSKKKRKELPPKSTPD